MASSQRRLVSLTRTCGRRTATTAMPIPSWTLRGQRCEKGLHMPSAPARLHDPRRIRAQTIVLTGCANGVGLGLDNNNRITAVDGGPAAASGQFAVPHAMVQPTGLRDARCLGRPHPMPPLPPTRQPGDRVVSVDGVPLNGQLIPNHLVRSQIHALIDKVGHHGSNWRFGSADGIYGPL